MVITATDSGDANYVPATATLSLTVAKAQVTVTAASKSWTLLTAPPALTWSQVGLVPAGR